MSENLAERKGKIDEETKLYNAMTVCWMTHTKPKNKNEMTKIKK